MSESRNRVITAIGGALDVGLSLAMAPAMAVFTRFLVSDMIILLRSVVPQGYRRSRIAFEPAPH